MATGADDGTRVRSEDDVRERFEGVLSQLDAMARWASLSGHEQDRWLCWVATTNPRHDPPKVRMYEAAHRLANGKLPPGRRDALMSWVRATLHDFGFA